MYNSSNSGMAMGTGSTLSASSAGGAGGIDNYGTLTVSDSILSGSSAQDYRGGGIDNAYQATLTVSNSTLSSSSANGNGYYGNGSGGGIDNCGALTVSNSTLSGSSAGIGGGIYMDI